MMRIEKADLRQMEKRFRLRLINSLPGFKSANLIGTIDNKGNQNLAIVSSVIHLGSDPALLGFISRPVVVPRDTCSNILDTGIYTINHISADFFKSAHQTSARYPADISEFDKVGLHPEFLNGFKAPFVKESQIKIGMALKEKIDIQSNGTIMLIGEIREIYFPEFCLSEDGYLDIEKAGSLTVSGLDGYHTTNQISRLSYAKPDQAVSELSTF